MSGEGMKALWQELVSWGVVNYGRLRFTARRAVVSVRGAGER